MNKSKPQPVLESFRKRSQTAHEPQPKGAELNWTNIKNKFFQPEIYQDNIGILFDEVKSDEIYETTFKPFEEKDIKLVKNKENEDFSPKNKELTDRTPKFIKNLKIKSGGKPQNPINRIHK